MGAKQHKLTSPSTAIHLLSDSVGVTMCHAYHDQHLCKSSSDFACSYTLITRSNDQSHLGNSINPSTSGEAKRMFVFGLLLAINLHQWLGRGVNNHPEGHAKSQAFQRQPLGVRLVGGFNPEEITVIGNSKASE
eukprot:s616_g14.t1